MNFVRRFTGQIVQLAQRRHSGINTYARAANEIFDKVRAIRENADKVEPSKLFTVELIKHPKGRPYWERDVLQLLGLEHDKYGKKMNKRLGVGTYVVVKNTPQMCRMLWKVKHLVRVKPITFPDGLPTPGVYTGTYLSRSGEFRKDASFTVEPERLLIDEKFDRVKLEGMEIAKPMQLKWMNSI